MQLLWETRQLRASGVKTEFEIFIRPRSVK
jgi:hypothetical protein